MRNRDFKIVYILSRIATFLLYIPYPLVATWFWRQAGLTLDYRPYHIMVRAAFAGVLALLTYVAIFVYKKEWVIPSAKAVTLIDGALFVGILFCKDHALRAAVSSIELFATLFTVFLCFFISDILMLLKRQKQELSNLSDSSTSE